MPVIFNLNRPDRQTLRLMTALTTVYLVWGSTYLGIAIAIETIPPFLMLAIRFAIAGAVLFALAVGPLAFKRAARINRIFG